MPAGNSGQLWLVKTDAWGRVEWERAFKDEVGQGARGFSIVRAPEGGYVVAGERSTSLWETGNDGWLLKVREDGELEWTRRFVGSANERLLSLAVLPAGGYLLTGRMAGFCPVDGDVWWGRVDADGSVLVTNIVTVAPGYPQSGRAVRGARGPGCRWRGCCFRVGFWGRDPGCGWFDRACV